MQGSKQNELAYESQIPDRTGTTSREGDGCQHSKDTVQAPCRLMPASLCLTRYLNNGWIRYVIPRSGRIIISGAMLVLARMQARCMHYITAWMTVSLTIGRCQPVDVMLYLMGSQV